MARPPGGAAEIAPGLLRWLAPHPEWREDSDWEQQVASLLYELDGTAVLIDPLVPGADRDGFLAWLDDRVDGRAVTILTTVRWHRRDREELAARYRHTTTRAWNAIPAGVSPKPLRGAGETLLWLERARALVAGDALLGAAGGELRLCPEGWLKEERVDRRGLAQLMRPLLDLPIEIVSVSHGQPVLHDGRAALARALAEASG